MKHRYLVFEIPHFYPAGGMYDCVLKTLSLKTAVEFVVGKIKENPHSLTDYQIYDIVRDESECYSHRIDCSTQDRKEKNDES